MSGELLIQSDVGAPACYLERPGGIWHVLQTKARAEKALGVELSALGIHSLLPAVYQERYFGRRRAVVEVPVFPGLMFIRGNDADLDLAHQTMRVLQTIKVADQEALAWTLENLCLLSQWPVEITACSAMSCGRRVEVVGGSLRGVQALLGDRGDRLVFQVDESVSAVSVKLSGQTLASIA